MTFFVLFTLIVIYILIDFSENSDDFSDQGATFSQIWSDYYLNFIPEMLRLVSPLAIFVACLGLFGLSSFMAAQRTKEIGVRKVLGASIASILALLSKDFVKLIVLANLIALPLVYLAVSNWLNNFAFHTNIGWMMFVVPATLLLIISLVTVSFQTFKTGSMNPVQSLRQE